MPDLETAQRCGCGIAHLEIINPRARRTIMHLADQLLDRSLVTLDKRFDRTIGAIAHPASDVKFLRLLAGPCTEEDALDAAGQANPARNHQTTEISGASSAFMPTTL